MIVLDFENLNILVLFLLAFISFKSYQADHHTLQSDSDEEMSEISIKQSPQNQEEKIVKPTQQGSQIAQDNVEKRQGQLQAEQVNVQNNGPQDMIDEEAKIVENHQVTLEADPNQIEVADVIEEPQIEGQTLQNQNLNSDDSDEKCDQQLQFEGDDQSSSLRNPQSQSNGQEKEEKDQQNTSAPMQKMKKIQKLAKKLKKDLKKQAELTAKLQEESKISFW